MNLQMSGAVSWLGSGAGLSFNDGRLGTSAAASKLINALQSSGSSSFEVFALPANATQTGPARLVSVGGDNANQTFVLGQDGGEYQVRLLHTAKDSKARPRLQVVNGVSVAVQHIVHGYDGGVERFYIDGIEQPATVALSGNYSNWDSTDLFNVGNEASSERQFGGEIYLGEVYDRAPTPGEVQQNFAAGFGGTPPVNQSPVASAGTDQTAVLPNTLTLAGSQVLGPGTATFTDNTSLTSTVSFDADGSYTLRLTANDGEMINTDDVVITVDPIAPVTDVVGLVQAAAECAIVSAGLTVGTITTASSSTVLVGDVIDQNPLGGGMAVSGSTVDLTVSRGPSPVTVPDVVGLAQAAAESAIASASLTVGTITTANSDTVPAGDVINQSPLGNTLPHPEAALI